MVVEEVVAEAVKGSENCTQPEEHTGQTASGKDRKENGVKEMEAENAGDVKTDEDHDLGHDKEKEKEDTAPAEMDEDHDLQEDKECKREGSETMEMDVDRDSQEKATKGENLEDTRMSGEPELHKEESKCDVKKDVESEKIEEGEKSLDVQILTKINDKDEEEKKLREKKEDDEEILAEKQEEKSNENKGGEVKVEQNKNMATSKKVKEVDGVNDKAKENQEDVKVVRGKEKVVAKLENYNTEDLKEKNHEIKEKQENAEEVKGKAEVSKDEKMVEQAEVCQIEELEIAKETKGQVKDVEQDKESAEIRKEDDNVEVEKERDQVKVAKEKDQVEEEKENDVENKEEQKPEVSKEVCAEDKMEVEESKQEKEIVESKGEEDIVVEGNKEREESGESMEEDEKLEDSKDDEEKDAESKEKVKETNKGKRSRKRKKGQSGEVAEKKVVNEKKTKKATTSTETKKPSTPVAPLTDRPVRERKSVERLVASIEKEPSRGFLIGKGRGTPLGDIPNVAFKLSRKRTDETFIALHVILFGRRGKAFNVKQNISQFSGFSWHENEEKQKMKIKEKFDKLVKEKLLEFCDVLDIPVAKATTRKEDIVTKLLNFLATPQITTDVSLAEKESSTPRKRKRAVKDNPSSSGGTPFKSSGKKRTKTEDAHKGKDRQTASETEDESEEHEEEEKIENGAPDGSEDEVSEHSESEKEDEPKSEEGTRKQKHEFKKPELKESSGKSKSKKTPTAKKATPIGSPKKTIPKSSSKPSTVNDNSEANPRVFSRKKKLEETAKNKTPTSSKSSTKGKGSKEKLGKDVVKGKGKAKKENSGPTERELHKAICDILKEVDFNTATFTDILKQLAEHFDMDLTPRKGAIKLMIQEELTRLADEEDDDEDEDDQESGGQDDA